MMTRELALAVHIAGPDTVTAVAAYLRQPMGDGWMTAVRRTLAEVLDQADRRPNTGPDPVLVQLVGSWALVAHRDFTPLSYWLRQQTHPDTVPVTPITRLWQALAAEVDTALAAAMLLPDLDDVA